jgi:hypothetical protein
MSKKVEIKYISMTWRNLNWAADMIFFMQNLASENNSATPKDACMYGCLRHLEAAFQSLLYDLVKHYRLQGLDVQPVCVLTPAMLVSALADKGLVSPELKRIEQQLKQGLPLDRLKNWLRPVLSSSLATVETTLLLKTTDRLQLDLTELETIQKNLTQLIEDVHASLAEN